MAIVYYYDVRKLLEYFSFGNVDFNLQGHVFGFSLSFCRNFQQLTLWLFISIQTATSEFACAMRWTFLSIQKTDRFFICCNFLFEYLISKIIIHQICQKQVFSTKKRLNVAIVAKTLLIKFIRNIFFLCRKLIVKLIVHIIILKIFQNTHSKLLIFESNKYVIYIYIYQINIKIYKYE